MAKLLVLWFALGHSTSDDGVRWQIFKPPKACSRRVLWSEGVIREQRNLERPWLLIDSGRPTHLFLAIAAGSRSGGFERTWNLVIPLR